MRYDAFFQAFHAGENDGYLVGHTTTWQIPKFFAETVLQTQDSLAKLPQDDMSYDKWYQGNSSPRNHWNNFLKEYNEEHLADAIFEVLNDSRLGELLCKFEVIIERGEDINKKLLCTALAQQFKAIIDGKGEAENIVPDVYTSGNIQADFMDYINKATMRYNVMKLIGGDEVPLEKFFVCNTIGEKERVFADKSRIKCVYLDDPSLDSIRSVYSKRSYDNLKMILIGSGGCGKSLMLQHLFLKSAAEYTKTGVLPVFLELRYFTQGDDLVSFIVKTVYAKDERFTEDVAHKLMLSGRIQLLLDGFDEIDPSDIDLFLHKVEHFTDKYPKVQIVLSSRENEYLKGLHGFTKWYVWPFDNEQSEKLIDRILAYQNQMEEKQNVVEYISNGFLQKDGVFASHPLLLTYVAMRYPDFKRFNQDHKLFYKVTYEALLSGHDDNKKPYDRVFMSVDNAEQFSTVFKEFCAITYRDAAFQFNSTAFETYFKMLKSHKGFLNPYKMNVKNFKHDVCSTACMMYEKEYDMFYIDPGFQEFLFAEYYAQADIDEMPELLEALKRVSLTKLGRFDALDMLSNVANQKFKTYILVPFLDDIIKGKDGDSFTALLINCFDELNFINYNTTKIENYAKNIGAKEKSTPRIGNPAKSILLNYIFRELEMDPEYEIVLQTADFGDLPDGAEITGKLIAEPYELDGKPGMLIDCKPLDVIEYMNITYEQGYISNDWVLDNKKHLEIFGNKITVDGFELNTDPNSYAELIKNAMKNSSDAVKILSEIKKYRKQLKRELFRTGIR